MKNIILLLILLIPCGASAQNLKTYIYAIKGIDTLKMDVYTPKNIKKTDSLPVLLWMHGGGFSTGNRENEGDRQLVKYAAKEQNYIGISISYRLVRKGRETGFGCDCTKDEKIETFKQAAIDYMDAAKYVVENAEKLNINSTKIIAGGSSAGAEGILNAVFMREYFINTIEDYTNVSFAGVFSCAGAVLDASYIAKHNAVPSVLFHGTADPLVPFDNAPHHFCEPTKEGYLFLDGSNVIAKKLEQLDTSYYFNIVNGAKHEMSAVPFQDLDKVFSFFKHTIINNEIIQTKIIQTKKI